MVFSYARSQEKLKKLARDAGGKARAGTPDEASQGADALLLAVHWNQFDDVLKQAGHLLGKIIITCSLPMNDDNTDLVMAHTSSGAEELAKKVPKAHVVSAFNTVPSEVLFGVSKARKKTPRPSLVLCGDDPGAKEIATKLIRDVGFDPVDAGPLRSPIIRSRSRCSLASLPMKEKAARSWLIDLIDSEGDYIPSLTRPGIARR